MSGSQISHSSVTLSVNPFGYRSSISTEKYDSTFSEVGKTFVQMSLFPASKYSSYMGRTVSEPRKVSRRAKGVIALQYNCTHKEVFSEEIGNKLLACS